MSKQDFGYPNPSVGRVKVRQLYNLVKPNPGTHGTWDWLKSLSLDQIRLLDKWNRSEDMAEQAVIVLAVTGLEGGTIHEADLELLLKRVEEHIAFRLDEAQDD